MANEKVISLVSAINRALGVIEGVSYGLEAPVSEALVDAVQMIDEAVKEIADGNF